MVQLSKIKKNSNTWSNHKNNHSLSLILPKYLNTYGHILVGTH